MKNIILADNAGFCFGVKRAVDEALKSQKNYNKKIYTLGPLIHNDDVVDFLEKNNIKSISMDEIKSLLKGDIIVIRSHGVSKDVINILKEKELVIVNATCPYVTNIQKKAEKYESLGYKIVILGDKNHPEVIGINGWCNNNALITTNGIFDEELSPKVCVLSQTTEKNENYQNTLKNLACTAKEILAFNTICQATEVRQKSASEISKSVQIMIVVGGKHSSNTTKLYEICKKNCDATYHIENLTELKTLALDFKDKKIGVTAGASTPDWIINEVIDFLNK